jgi:predicted metalloprotease with PDZ domain
MVLGLPAFAFVLVAGAAAQSPPAMTVAVDAGEVTRGLLHVRETIPVVPGPLTLAYPKWIPGEHAPNGPIPNLASLAVAANGTPLVWRRDPIDLYTFHVDVPAGVAALDVGFDFLGSSVGHYSSARLASPTMFVLTWNKVVLAPDVPDYRTLQIAPSIHLPGTDWQFATALSVTSQQGADVRFETVSEAILIDSPLDAGVHVRKIPLGSIDGAPVQLDVFADTPAQLAADDATIAKFRNLVGEMHALYRARHFDHYDFLLTVSDVLPGEGVEHHQSSDDGTAGDFLIDPASLAHDGDLLPHEFNHSWDGKFRRPADLATLNLQAPMQDDLLWVYEGMTQFYGELQAERSGIWTKGQWFDSLASAYAELDSTPGRLTRPLLDTAVSGPFLYDAGRQWESIRRSVDFYPEGALMWLEADVTIRRLSHGKRSIDDFARAFFGRGDTGPEVITYTRDDVVAALNAVQPYDWRQFFAQRIDAIAPHPPDPFDAAGWHVVFEPAPNAFAKLEAMHDKVVDARYSLGLVTSMTDGTVMDVIAGSPAARAGLAPGQKLVAINDRAAEHDLQSDLDTALRAAQHGPSLRLLVVGGEVYRDVSVDYHGGPRFPHLERIAGSPDLLSVVAASRRTSLTTAAGPPESVRNRHSYAN